MKKVILIILAMAFGLSLFAQPGQNIPAGSISNPRGYFDSIGPRTPAGVTPVKQDTVLHIAPFKIWNTNDTIYSIPDTVPIYSTMAAKFDSASISNDTVYFYRDNSTPLAVVLTAAIDTPTLNMVLNKGDSANHRIVVTTLKSTSLTDSSGVFTGPGGILQTDSAGFQYRRDTKTLSIGGDPYDEPAPFGIDLHQLEVINDSAEGSRALLQLTSYTNNASTHIRTARGSLAFPKALQAGDAIMSTGYRGFDGTRFPGSHAAFQVFARENFSLTGGGCYMEFAVSPNGVGDSRKQKLFIYNEKVEHVNENDSLTRGTIDRQYSTSAHGSRIIGTKARGTYASPTTIVTGDTLGQFVTMGYDGSAFIRAGGISMRSTGTIASGRVPSEMLFMTATNAAPSVPTVAMVIDNGQTVRVPGFFGVGPTTPTKGIFVSGTSLDQNTIVIQPTTTTQAAFLTMSNLGGTHYFAVDNSTGSQFGNGAYAMNMFTTGNNNIGLATNSILRVIVSKTGKTTFRDSVVISQTPASSSTDDSIAVLDATTKLIRTIAQPLSGSAILDFPLTVNQASADLTITVTGAVMGDVVALGVPPGSTDADSCYTAWVSGANTVTVRFNNYSSGVIDPVSNTFKVKVLR